MSLDFIAETGDVAPMRYPGGKGKSYQHVINLLPPHTTYIETHLGGGAVLRNKRPAAHSIGVDRDPGVIASWQSQNPALAQFVLGDAIDFLRGYDFRGEEVVYCDPPYLPSTRKRSRVYRFDYTENDHLQLLDTLRYLPCRVVLSAYPSALYEEALAGWNCSTFQSKTHDTVRQELLWFNFERPRQLHDPRYLGRSFREREVHRRRISRIKDRIARLSPIEQFHLSEWLTEFLRENSLHD